MTGRRGALFLALLATLVLAVACGHSEETTAPPAQVTPTPAPAPSAPAAGSPAAPTPLGELAGGVTKALEGAAGTKAPEATKVPFPELVAKSIPLQPAPAPQSLAGKNVGAVRCTLNGVELLDDSSFEAIGRIELADDGMLYVIDNEFHVRRFSVEDTADACTLTLDTSFGQGGVLDPGSKVKEVSATKGGRLLLSGGFGNTYRLTKGQVDVTCTTPRQGYLVAAPEGSRILGHFVSPPMREVAFTDATCTAEDWALPSFPLKSVNMVAFVGPNIAVGGQLAEKVGTRNPHVVVVLSKSGAEQYRFGNTDEGFGDDHFGWVHAIEPCGKSICVLDSNFRRLSMWKTGGAFEGAISLSKLFGLDYPWINDMEMIPGNKAFFSVTQQREAQGGEKRSGVYEGMIFRATWGG